VRPGYSAGQYLNNHTLNQAEGKWAENNWTMLHCVENLPFTHYRLMIN